MALTPMAWAGKVSMSEEPSLLNVRTEIFPSLEAQAKIGPNSYGAQEIELTLALCAFTSLIFSHSPALACCCCCPPLAPNDPADAEVEGEVSFQT